VQSIAQKSQVIHLVLSSVLQHASSPPYLIFHFTAKELSVFRLYVLISSSARSRRNLVCTVQSLSYYFFRHFIKCFILICLCSIVHCFKSVTDLFLMCSFFIISIYVAVCRFCAIRCLIIIWFPLLFLMTRLYVF